MVKVAGAARGVWRLMLLALIAALCVITGPVAAAGAVSAVPAGAAPATTTSAGFTYDPSTPWAGVEQRATDGDIGSASGSTDAPRPETDAGVAAEDVPQLATYGGGETSGVLVRSDGSATDLTSGLKGPSALLPKPRPGMNGNIVGHVESHAAALMRQEGLDEAALWINRAPCGGPNGCAANLSRMVPQGSTLNVFVMPGGSAAEFEDWFIVTGTG